MALILFIGKNSSGKSIYAEKLISTMGNGKRYYIATMIPSDEPGFKRVERHRAQREGLGFETIEIPYGFEALTLDENSNVLLEDVSNLLANIIFEKKETSGSVLREIEILRKKCQTLVVITISGLVDGDYDEETNAYVSTMNALNEQLVALADTVYEMKDGEPILTKGATPCA